MGKPVVGEIVVLPFPQTNLLPGKRRPALVVANLTGDDLIPCQITSQAHRDSYAVPFDHQDCTTGKLSVPSFIRPNRLFTVEQSVVLYSAAKLNNAKLDETLAKIRSLFT